MVTDEDSGSLQLPILFFVSGAGYSIAPNGTRHYFSWAVEDEVLRRVPISRDEFLNRSGHEVSAMLRLRFLGTALSFSVLRSDAALGELKVTADQRSKLKALVSSVEDEIWKARPMPTGGQRPTDEEFAEVAASSWGSAAAAIVRSHESELLDVLNSDQYRRLREILLQANGAKALLDENVASTLTLTDDQKSKLREIDSNSRKEVWSFPRPNNWQEAQEESNKIRDILKRRDDKLRGVLSADQASQFEQAQGRAFDLDSLRAPGQG